MDKNCRFQLSIPDFTFNTGLIELLLSFIEPSKLATYIFFGTCLLHAYCTTLLERAFSRIRFQFLFTKASRFS